MNAIKKTLETIQHQELTPIPHWQFLLKRYGLWGISLLLLVCGSLGIGSILYVLTKNDWDIYRTLDRSPVGHMLSTLPYLWLSLFLVMLILLYLDLKHTTHGYRYSAMSIVCSIIVLSTALGTIIFLTGISEQVDTIILHRAPQQAYLFNPRIASLNHPEHGVLMGEIKEIITVSSTLHIYIFIPHEQESWDLILREDAHIPAQGIRVHDRIRATGRIIDPEKRLFEVKLLLPFNHLNTKQVPRDVPSY